MSNRERIFWLTVITIVFVVFVVLFINDLFFHHWCTAFFDAICAVFFGYISITEGSR